MRIIRPSLSLTLSVSVVALAAPAWGQSTAELPAPPVRSSVDERGVNLATGKVQLTDPQISIGGDGNGLKLERYFIGSGRWRHNYEIVGSGSSGKFLVSIGNSLHMFTQVGGVYVPDDKNGSTLTFFVEFNRDRFRYTTRDGVSVVGSVTHYKGGVWYYDGHRIEYPNGSRDWINSVSYSPDGYNQVTRVYSVTNSFGYQLKFSYALNNLSSNPSAEQIEQFHRLTKVQAINNAVDFCDRHAEACTGLSQSWPSVTYSQSTTGGVTTEVVTDPQNRQRRYITDSAGRITGIRRPSSPSADNVTYGYDANGRVSSVTVAGLGTTTGAGTWNYTFTPGTGTMTAEVKTPTLPAANARVVVSDTAVGLPISVKDENLKTTSFEYCPSGTTDCSPGYLTKVTQPEGNYATFKYDGRQNLKTTTAWAKGGVGSLVVSSATYPADCTTAPSTPANCNKPRTTTDSANNVTDYDYNADGTPIFVRAPAPTSGAPRPEVRYSYTTRYPFYKETSNSVTQGPHLITLPTGTATCLTGAWGCAASDQRITEIAYPTGSTSSPTNLLPSSTTEKRGGTGGESATTSYGYNNIADVTSVTNALGKVLTMTYAADRQLTSVRSPSVDGTSTGQKRETVIHYNSDGLSDWTSMGAVNWNGSAYVAATPVQKVLTEYDVAGRVKAQRLADGTGTTFYSLNQRSYDGAGRLECETVRLKSTDFGAPPAPCTVGTADADGKFDRVTRYLWEYAGALERMQSAYGTALQQDEVRYTRTSNGLVSSMIDAKGNVTSYAYDAYDRSLRECYNASVSACETNTAGDVVRLTYDAYGRLDTRSLRGQALAIGYAYDNLGRLKTVNYPGSGPFDADVTYTYDNLGRMTLASDGSHTATFGYDALGRVTSQGDAVSTRTMLYDANGRRTQLTWPDGRYVTYQYNDVDEMKTILENGSTPLATFGYDAIGRRNNLTRGNGVVTSYSYDGASRLECLRHDLAGGSTLGCAPATASGQDQAWTYTYNAAGQIKSRTGANDAYAFTKRYNVSRDYTANALNQYTASGSVVPTYDLQGNLKTAGVPAAYTYSTKNELIQRDDTGVQFYHDPLGRLDQVINAPGGTYGFQYVDGQISDEYAASSGNPILRRYVYGPSVDEPIVWYEGADFSSKRYLLADERGSVVAVTDASGAATAINSYDEYGIPDLSDITNKGRFRFTGQAWLSELGMYSFKARIYSPTWGRFLQIDPAGYPDGPNWYSYANLDPVNRTDPYGLQSNTPESTPFELTATIDLGVPLEENSYFDFSRFDSQMYFVGGGFVASQNLALDSITGSSISGGMTASAGFSALGALAGGASIVAGAWLSIVNDEGIDKGKVGYHYTNGEGYVSIMKSGVIRANSRNMTYFTQHRLPAAMANTSLFLNAPSHLGRGDYVVAFRYPSSMVALPDPSIPMGLYTLGSIRDGRSGVNFIYVGRNEF